MRSDPGLRGGSAGSARVPDLLTMYRAGFEQSLVPQVFLDASGRIVEVNRAYCNLLGRDVSDLVGRASRELLHPSNPEPVDPDRNLRSILDGSELTGQVERILQHADGRPIAVRVDATAVRDEHGKVFGLVALLQDLTPLRDAEERMRVQEDFFQAISQEGTDVAIVADPLGTVVYASPTFAVRLAYDLTDVVGSHGSDFIHPDDIERNREVFQNAVVGGGSGTLTLRVCDAHGQYRWYECTYRNLLDTAIGGVVTNLRDVTDRLEAEKALRVSEARYRAIADHADEGLWLVRCDGRTLYANNRLCEILGVSAEEIYERSAPDLFGATGSVIAQKLVHRHEVGPERYELTYDHPDGRQRVLSFSTAPLPDETEQECSIGLITDITASRRLEEELRDAALHDSLTGLPNRALLLDRLEQALAREQDSTAVIFIDIDHFKVVNDARGHMIGDELLVAVADRLRNTVRPIDTVARFGGDEFVIVCEGVTDVWAMTAAENLLAAFEEPFVVTGGPVHSTVSVGVALSPPDNAADLLRNADTAMYAAKSAGRQRVRLFDQGLATEAADRYFMAAELRKALSADTLEVHYQPIVDLKSGDVLGAEALCRWHHPEIGTIPPAKFVPLAEEAGLAPELDRWVAHHALEGAGRLREAGALPPTAYVAINVSPRSLLDRSVVAHLVDCTRRAGLSPQHVVMEVTEGALMGDPTTTAEILGRIRAAGLQVAIDDFGTGHSSLAYIDRFPATMLKIDRSFVTELATDATSRAIVSSIIELARAIGVQVVAEGIENEEQARFLRDLGCLAGQGWLWSRAVSLEDALACGVLAQRRDLPG